MLCATNKDKLRNANTHLIQCVKCFNSADIINEHDQHTFSAYLITSIQILGNDMLRNKKR